MCITNQLAKTGSIQDKQWKGTEPLILYVYIREGNTMYYFSQREDKILRKHRNTQGITGIMTLGLLIKQEHFICNRFAYSTHYSDHEGSIPRNARVAGKHSMWLPRKAWLQKKCDYRTHRQTDRFDWMKTETILQYKTKTSRQGSDIILTLHNITGKRSSYTLYFNMWRELVV